MILSDISFEDGSIGDLDRVYHGTYFLSDVFVPEIPENDQDRESIVNYWNKRIDRISSH